MGCRTQTFRAGQSTVGCASNRVMRHESIQRRDGSEDFTHYSTVVAILPSAKYTKYYQTHETRVARSVKTLYLILG